MSRADVEKDIAQTIGQVPDFFQAMPDDTLEHEWAMFKTFQLEDTALTARDKQLIGLGVAAATYCQYCTYFHAEASKMLGATEAQIEEAVRMASETRKYSTYLHGLQIPIERFKQQSDEMGAYMQEQAEKQAA